MTQVAPVGQARRVLSEAAAALLDEVRAGDLVLIKGSRGVRTDRIVSLLRECYPLRRQR